MRVKWDFILILALASNHLRLGFAPRRWRSFVFVLILKSISLKHITILCLPHVTILPGQEVLLDITAAWWFVFLAICLYMSVAHEDLNADVILPLNIIKQLWVVEEPVTFGLYLCGGSQPASYRLRQVRQQDFP